MLDKKADLAGPGIGNYNELEKMLPKDYKSLLNRKDTQKAIFEVKNYIEENLCKELNLMMVTCPLIVDKDSGVNDLLDRDGSRTPIEFPCGLGLEKPIKISSDSLGGQLNPDNIRDWVENYDEIKKSIKDIHL